MQTKKSIDDILFEHGLESSPSYYSGLGTRNMFPSILGKIYKDIIVEYGEDAGKNFVQMVNDVPKLTTTDFLLSLHKLVDRGWKWDRSLVSNRNGIYADDEGSAFGTVMSVLGGSSAIDDTGYIRAEFLKKYAKS